MDTELQEFDQEWNSIYGEMLAWLDRREQDYADKRTDTGALPVSARKGT